MWNVIQSEMKFVKKNLLSIVDPLEELVHVSRDDIIIVIIIISFYFHQQTISFKFHIFFLSSLKKPKEEN